MSTFNMTHITKEVIFNRIPEAKGSDVQRELFDVMIRLWEQDRAVWQSGGKNPNRCLAALRSLRWCFRDILMQVSAEVVLGAAKGRKVRMEDKLPSLRGIKAYFEGILVSFKDQYGWTNNFETHFPWVDEWLFIGEDDDGRPLFKHTEFREYDQFLEYIASERWAVKALQRKLDAPFSKSLVPSLDPRRMRDGLLGERMLSNLDRMTKGKVSRELVKMGYPEGPAQKTPEALRMADELMATHVSWIFGGVTPPTVRSYVDTVGRVIKAWNHAIEALVYDLGQKATAKHIRKDTVAFLENPEQRPMRFHVFGQPMDTPDLATLVTEVQRLSAGVEIEVNDYLDTVRLALPDNVLAAVDLPLHGGYVPVDPDNGVFTKLPAILAEVPDSAQAVEEMWSTERFMAYALYRTEAKERATERAAKALRANRPGDLQDHME
jgi:hypothetical protein